MALQLITAREALGAVGPVAGEWLIPGMPAEVSPQMRRLAVGLVAEVADVQPLLVATEQRVTG